MRTQSLGVGRAIAFGAFLLSVIAGPLLFAANASAQTASAHDAAVEATRRGDYVGALDLAKKAAAAGQPLEADQVDFIAGKAAKQQAAAEEAAKIKATQTAASATAQQIMDRQQKDYADRAKRKATPVNCAVASGQQAMAVGQFTSSYAAAAGQVLGPGGFGGPAFSGAPAAPSPLSNEQPGSCPTEGGNPGSRIVK